MYILITDLTLMREGGNLCLAGWNFEDQRMVRPLPNGQHWHPKFVDALGLSPGMTIRVQPFGGSSRDYPHRTEDQPIDPNVISVVRQGFSDWVGAAGPQSHPSISAAFSGNVLHNSQFRGVAQGVYVTPRIQCPSLAGVDIHRGGVRLLEAFEKLKAEIDDGASKRLLTVTSKRLRDAWSTGGLEAAAQELPRREIFHVRLGLAHAFGDPPKCYMMLNGVL